MKKDNFNNLRHTTSHLLAAAVLDIWPKTKIALGPPIEDGFYYDFDFGNEKISDEDLPKIEKTMKALVKDWSDVSKLKESASQIKKRFKGNVYKLELIEDIKKEGGNLSLYKSGNFVDLCKGGHVKNPSGEIKHFKLLSVAGAYWRGSEKNKMLTRIYGTVFPTKSGLDSHLTLLEQARENDHRKLGKKLDLFAFSDLVGKGLVMYTPKGTILKNELQKAVLDSCKEFGAMEVNIPHMAKLELYEISGHADKFKEELFFVKSHYKEEFVLKPVNCPHHTQIYASKPRSYKDLPISYVESTQQHRDEKPGSIGGLNRTRSFEIDDGHTFCTKEQTKDEIIKLIKAAEKFYKQLGMWENHWVSLSFKDPKTPEKYIGDEKDWKEAQDTLKKVDTELNLNGKIMLGEAALYGPKIDIMVKDSIGKDIQLGTFQIDFAMPKRFGLVFTDKNATEKTPVMIHRAILGSYGRFIANLLEKTGGAFPVWLSPVQVKILPITEKQRAYAKKVYELLIEEGVRVELDSRNETLSNKIRLAQEEKVPYMLILGEKESASNKVAVRLRNGKDIGQLSTQDFVGLIKEKIDSKSLDL